MKKKDNNKGLKIHPRKAWEWIPRSFPRRPEEAGMPLLRGGTLADEKHLSFPSLLRGCLEKTKIAHYSVAPVLASSSMSLYTAG
ncbi:MAG: hypothetical protein K2W99_00655, partial [Chthoniobacterales bacterium]|nr:hypothetical protein [Chthoniobacterales bacterium]